MQMRLGFKFLLAALALLACSIAVPARADEALDKGNRRLVVEGSIIAVLRSDAGRVLTIDRGDVDDDPADDVRIQLTAVTKIVPNDGEVVVGLEVKAILLPALPDELAVAAQLILKDDDDDDEEDDRRRKMHACGTIATLPTDPHNGTWTVTVKDIGDFSFLVNADTELKPDGATPAVGDRACFEAHQTDSGWLAEEVELKDQDEDDDHGHHARRVELNGIIKTLPDDRSGEWDLVLTLAGRGDVTIHVDQDTEIEGDLAVGAHVGVRAEVEVDNGGNESYLAERIKLLGEKGGGHDKAPKSVHIEGTVTAVSSDGTTWTLDDEGTIIMLTVTLDTWVRGLLPGQSPVGRHVEGVAKRQADGSLVAKLLTIEHS
jgi:hypothetical protein